MVPLLQRLTLQRSLDTLGDGNLPALMAEPSALGLQRQSARMLALLASDPAAQPAISRSAWVRMTNVLKPGHALPCLNTCFALHAAGHFSFSNSA